MLIFNKLRYKNFLSTGNVFTEIDFTKYKMNLISGKNGGGKSTILDALIFALYGKPFRKIVKGALMNTINKKDMVVELELTVGANEYKIIRGEKPKVFEVYQNGTLKDQTAAVKDYQTFIEEDLIKSNYKTLTQVVVLGSATYVPFMELEKADRRKVIEDILDIGVFSEIVSGPLKQDLDDIKDSLNDVKNKMSEMEIRISMIKENNDKIIKSKSFDPTDTENEIVELEGEIAKLERLKKKYEDKIESLITPDIDKTEIKTKIQKRREIRSDINSNRKNLEKEMQFLEKNEVCPTCNQNITVEFRHATCETNRQQIEEIDVGLQKIDKFIDKYEEELNKIESHERELSKFQSEYRDIISEIRLKNKHIEVLRDNITKVIAKQNESLDLQDDSEYKEQLQNLMKQYDELTFEKNVIMEIAKMSKDDGIKSEIIKKYIPVMNTIINDYLAEFDLYVNFVLDEQFEEKILSRYRDTFSYRSFSQGEKLRINLAIMLAWKEIAKQKNSISTNLLILDETLDGALDNAGVGDLIKALKNLEGDKNNIYVISHRGDDIKDHFDNHLHFEKHKNFSIMNEIQ